mgnify:FL=1
MVLYFHCKIELLEDSEKFGSLIYYVDFHHIIVFEMILICASYDFYHKKVRQVSVSAFVKMAYYIQIFAFLHSYSDAILL